MKFGEIEGLVEGDLFRDQRELFALGFHGDRQQGIHGSQVHGAESVVISGGYEDDEDNGDTILYTGMTPGTWDRERKTTKGHQTFTGKNKALAKNRDHSIPLRVFRSYKHRSNWSPAEGIVYSGLYLVTNYWKTLNSQGHIIFRFRLQKLSNLSDNPAPRRTVVREEAVRYDQIPLKLKELYGYKCQVCGISLPLPTGNYAQCAHIKPLGSPHNGADRLSNVLCLCPNHHVMFDAGAFTIADNFSLIGIEGTLNVASGHALDLEMIKFHRSYIFVQIEYWNIE